MERRHISNHWIYFLKNLRWKSLLTVSLMNLTKKKSNQGKSTKSNLVLRTFFVVSGHLLLDFERRRPRPIVFSVDCQSLLCLLAAEGWLSALELSHQFHAALRFPQPAGIFLNWSILVTNGQQIAQKTHTYKEILPFYLEPIKTHIDKHNPIK